MSWHSDEYLPVHDRLRRQSDRSLSRPACEASWPHVLSGAGVPPLLVVPATCDGSSGAHGRSLCGITWKEAVDTDADSRSRAHDKGSHTKRS